MRKEILYVIFAGIFFGLIVAFGIWRINIVLNRGRVSISKTPLPIPTASFGLTLSKPENGSVITTSPATFIGLTKPESWVIVSINESDNLLTASSSGIFEKDLELDSGINRVIATSVDMSGETVSQDMTLVFSTEFAKNITSITTPTLQPATNESDIRQKVALRVSEILKNPKAYLGTITTIAETNIQIKTSAGEIKLISVDPKDIAVVESNSVNKGLKFTDLAIGDFIVAMGFQSANSVLETKRILLTDTPKEPKFQLFLGKVVDTTGMTSISVALAKDGAAVSVSAAKGSGIRLSKFSEGDMIIIVGTKGDDGSISARSIFKVGSSPTPTPKSAK